MTTTRERLLQILKEAVSDKDFQWQAMVMLCSEIDRINTAAERTAAVVEGRTRSKR